MLSPHCASLRTAPLSRHGTWPANHSGFGIIYVLQVPLLSPPMALTFSTATARATSQSSQHGKVIQFIAVTCNNAE